MASRLTPDLRNRTKVDSWCVSGAGVDVSCGRRRVRRSGVVSRSARRVEGQPREPGRGWGGEQVDDEEVEQVEDGGWWVANVEL